MEHSVRQAMTDRLDAMIDPLGGTTETPSIDRGSLDYWRAQSFNDLQRSAYIDSLRDEIVQAQNEARQNLVEIQRLKSANDFLHSTIDSMRAAADAWQARTEAAESGEIGPLLAKTYREGEAAGVARAVQVCDEHAARPFGKVAKAIRNQLVNSTPQDVLNASRATTIDGGGGGDAGAATAE